MLHSAPTRRQIGGAAAIRVAPAPEPIIAEPDTAVTPIDGGSGLHQRHASKQPLAAHSSEEDVEEEVELPEDLKDLPPQVQQRRIKMRAAWMMALGTVIVIVGDHT